MIDFDALVLGPSQAVFGEPATFNYVASAPLAAPFEGRGIYSERPVDVQLTDGSIMSSREITLDVRDSELPRVPQQGDRVTFRSKSYVVEDGDPDGQGATRLSLKELPE